MGTKIKRQRVAGALLLFTLWACSTPENSLEPNSEVDGGVKTEIDASITDGGISEIDASIEMDLGVSKGFALSECQSVDETVKYAGRFGDPLDEKLKIIVLVQENGEPLRGFQDLLRVKSGAESQEILLPESGCVDAVGAGLQKQADVHLFSSKTMVSHLGVKRSQLVIMESTRPKSSEPISVRGELDISSRLLPLGRTLWIAKSSVPPQGAWSAFQWPNRTFRENGSLGFLQPFRGASPLSGYESFETEARDLDANYLATVGGILPSGGPEGSFEPIMVGLSPLGAPSDTGTEVRARLSHRANTGPSLQLSPPELAEGKRHLRTYLVLPTGENIRFEEKTELGSELEQLSLRIPEKTGPFAEVQLRVEVIESSAPEVYAYRLIDDVENHQGVLPGIPGLSEVPRLDGRTITTKVDAELRDIVEIFLFGGQGTIWRVVTQAEESGELSFDVPHLPAQWQGRLRGELNIRVMSSDYQGEPSYGRLRRHIGLRANVMRTNRLVMNF